MTALDRALDRLDRIAVGTAAGIFLGSLATSPGGQALGDRLAFAVAMAALAYATVWVVSR